MVGHPSLPDHADVEASAGREGGGAGQAMRNTYLTLPTCLCMHACTMRFDSAGGRAPDRDRDRMRLGMTPALGACGPAFFCWPVMVGDARQGQGLVGLGGSWGRTWGGVWTDGIGGLGLGMGR